MKRSLIISIITLSTISSVFGQVSTLNNTWAFALNEYLGWDNTSNTSLRFKHELAQPMQFYTGAGTGTFNNMRMTILGNYNGAGLIGMGDMGTFAAPFTPTNLLHLHRAGTIVSLYEQFTNLNTGITATDGLLFGMRHDNPSNLDIAEIRHQENAPFGLWTGDNSAVNQRMYVHYNNLGGFANTDLTRMAIVENGVGFGPGITGRSLLHLGFPDALTNGGYRAWMDIGTFNHGISDEAYFGLKLEPWSNLLWTDNMDAVIGWGDNIETPEGADNLRFIFTAIQTAASSTAGQFDGLEVGRFTPTGRFGVGNFTQPGAGAGSGVQPARRLEVYGENLDAWLNHTAAPQLRLTFTPATVANTATTGVWTDFQTMDVGDLFIHSYGLVSAGGATLTDRRVGINVSTPLAVLNVDGRNVNSALNPGDVFRTDGPSNTAQTWTMFKNNVEYGRLTNPAAANNFTIQATQRHLNFNSGNNGTALEAMRIVGANNANKRFVGIGDYSSANFNEAQNQLHQWIAGTANVYHQFSNDNTTATDDTQGFKIGITYNGNYSDAELLSQQAGANMNFYTNPSGGATNRMQIRANGNVGIGVTNTSAKVEVSNAAVSNAIGLILTNTTSTGSTGISSAVTGGNGYYVDGINQTVTGISACIARGLYADVSSGGASYINALDLNLNSTGASSILKGMFVSIPSLSSCTSYGAFTSLGGAFATAFTPTYTGYKATVSATSGSTFESSFGVDVTVRNGYGIRGINSYVYDASHLSYAGYFASFISGTGSGPASSFGIYSEASGGNINWGVQSTATGGVESYGVSAQASGGSSHNYAILGATTSILTGTNGTLTGTSTPADAAGFFVGDVFTNGNYFDASDAMLKQNITDLTNATAIINQLHPKVYNYDTLQFGYMALAKGQQFGLLAQELDSVLPQFVKPLVQPAVRDSAGNIIYQELDFKGVTYVPLITLLLAGFKEQQQQINDLQVQLTNCCGAPRPLAPSQGNNEKTIAIDVKLTNGENSILYQNEPNPYTSSTTIRYFIPENTMNVKITFQDATGKTLKEVSVSEIGQGLINVDGSELISGTYTYSLVVSGKVIDTKKMVKAK